MGGGCPSRAAASSRRSRRSSQNAPSGTIDATIATALLLIGHRAARAAHASAAERPESESLGPESQPLGHGAPRPSRSHPAAATRPKGHPTGEPPAEEVDRIACNAGTVPLRRTTESGDTELLMRWPWQRAPSFARVVRADPGTADRVIAFALEQRRPSKPPGSAFLIRDGWHADGEVRNGGFSQLIYNDGGTERLPRYIEAFVAIGANEAAQLFETVRDACRRDQAPVDQLCRGQYWGDPLASMFDELNRRYFPLSHHVGHCLIDYMLAREEPWYDAATAVADEQEKLTIDATRSLDSALVYGHVELLRAALDAGANLAEHRGIDGEAVLHQVRDWHEESFIRALLAGGAPIDVASERGETPLHRAAHQNPAAVRLLLAGGARVDARDRHGATPLHGARPDEVVAALLAAGADPCAQLTNGFRPIHMAKSVDIVDRLIAAGADLHAVARDGTTSLHRFASWGDAPLVRHVLALGFEPDVRDERGLAPMHDALDAEIVAALVDHGAHIEARDHRGRTPLMTVSRPDVVRALLARGARIDAVDDRGRTVLHHPRAAPEVARLMVAAGARLDVRDGHGRTPFEHARQARVRTKAEEERTRDLDDQNESDYAWIPTLEQDDSYCKQAWVDALERG